MSQTRDRLAAEAYRIVESPYPTQLQTLYSILQDCNSLDVEYWAYDQPHHARNVVAAVLAALPQWQYCLDILAELVCIQELRDHALRIQPTLLITLIDQWIDAAPTEPASRLHAIHALARRPLPEDRALPASIQTLLIRLFEQLATSPSAEALARANDLITGGCKPVLCVLPVEVLQHFERNVFKLLRDASDMEQQSNGIYCLSIMRSLLEVGEYQPTWQAWDRTTMLQFFSGNKASKTIQLAVLQAIWQCSSDRPATTANPASIILLAAQVVSAIPENIRSSWCRENVAILQKLFSRLSRPDLSERLKLSLLSFTCCLCPTDYFASSCAMDHFVQLMYGVSDVEVAAEELNHALGSIIPKLAVQLPADFLPNLFRQLQAIMSSRHAAGSSIRKVAIAAMQLVDNCHALTALQYDGLKTMDSQSLILLIKDVSQQGSLREQSGIGTYHARSQLSAVTQRLLLSIALHGSRFGLTWPADVCQSLTRPPQLSELPQNFVRGQEFLYKQKRTPPLVRFDDGLPWQDSLSKALRSRSDAEIKEVEALVHEACRELESRLSDVETPLRKEQARVAELEQRCDELEEGYGQLESELMDRNLQIKEAEEQVRAYAQDLEAAGREHESLLSRVTSAEARLQEQILKSEAQMRETASEIERREYVHTSEVSTLRKKIGGMEEDAQQRTVHIQQLDTERATLKAEVDHLRKCLGGAQDAHEQQQARANDQESRLSAQDDQLKKSHEAHQRLVQELDSYKKAKRSLAQKAESLATELQEARSMAERDRADFLTDYQDKARQARAQWESAEAQLQARIDLLERQQEEQTHAHDEAIHVAEERMRQQNRQIARLKKEHTAKDSELRAAQEMRNRLMSAMGISNPPVQAAEPAQSTLPIRSLSSMETPRPSAVRKTADASHSDSEMFDDSFASADLESSPQKPQREMMAETRVPVLEPPRELGGRRTRRSLAASAVKQNRPPLGTASSNISPIRKTPGKVAFKDVQPAQAPPRDEDLQLVEGWSFSTDALTSTPGLGLRATNIEDDTTVDL